MLKSILSRIDFLQIFDMNRDICALMTMMNQWKIFDVEVIETTIDWSFE